MAMTQGKTRTDVSTKRSSLVAAVWREFWTFPFRLLRDLYWAMDRDAKVRALGVQTVGRVVSTRTETYTDSEGGVSRTHYLKYEVQADGQRRTVEKKVGRLDGLHAGVPVKAYFLAGTLPLDVAVDANPRPLGDYEVQALEASTRRAMAEARMTGAERR